MTLPAFSPLALWLLGWLLAAALMLVLWLVHLRTKNASIVDPGWALGVALIALLYAVLGQGDPWRRAIVAGMALAWGLRLSGYLFFTRVLGHPEEGRYVRLRETWAPRVEWKFLLFFQAQALLCAALSFPFLFPALDGRPGIRPLEWAGIALWLAALAGESLADRQLHRFKSDPASRGKVCRAGLWRWSRHPNFFFEWLVWVAWALFALPAPNGWAGLLSPALMLYSIACVTGIPPTEEQALRSRGEAYREYQRTTSPFFPWPPRS